uniref:Uncharacterized protein n=1 Tax=uncultured marine virus TaxID=186617 RepID=A0A0F7LBE8_9VIRU|nr:hypothetical protein [uncultured marine virus]
MNSAYSSAISFRCMSWTSLSSVAIGCPITFLNRIAWPRRSGIDMLIEFGEDEFVDVGLCFEKVIEA